MKIYSENLESKKTTLEGNLKFHCKKYESLKAPQGLGPFLITIMLGAKLNCIFTQDPSAL